MNESLRNRIPQTSIPKRVFDINGEINARPGIVMNDVWHDARLMTIIGDNLYIISG